MSGKLVIESFPKDIQVLVHTGVPTGRRVFPGEIIANCKVNQLMSFPMPTNGSYQLRMRGQYGGTHYKTLDCDCWTDGDGDLRVAADVELEADVPPYIEFKTNGFLPGRTRKVMKVRPPPGLLQQLVSKVLTMLNDWAKK
jgi:hypothetical protein